jgi:hypothetical protein
MNQKRKQRPKKAEPAEIPPSFAPVVAAFADAPEVRHGRMFSSNAVLNVNGKIFAMCVNGKLVVKLPGPRIDELINRGHGERFDPGHGRLMKEWVALDVEAGSWVELAREAYRFVKRGKS